MFFRPYFRWLFLGIMGECFRVFFGGWGALRAPKGHACGGLPPQCSGGKAAGTCAPRFVCTQEGAATSRTHMCRQFVFRRPMPRVFAAYKKPPGSPAAADGLQAGQRVYLSSSSQVSWPRIRIPVSICSMVGME